MLARGKSEKKKAAAAAAQCVYSNERIPRTINRTGTNSVAFCTTKFNTNIAFIHIETLLFGLYNGYMLWCVDNTENTPLFKMHQHSVVSSRCWHHFTECIYECKTISSCLKAFVCVYYKLYIYIYEQHFCQFSLFYFQPKCCCKMHLTPSLQNGTTSNKCGTCVILNFNTIPFKIKCLCASGVQST